MAPNEQMKNNIQIIFKTRGDPTHISGLKLLITQIKYLDKITNTGVGNDFTVRLLVRITIRLLYHFEISLKTKIKVRCFVVQNVYNNNNNNKLRSKRKNYGLQENKKIRQHD